MNPAPLLEELARRPLCCDGGMGTQLMARGLPTGACGMVWNLDEPAHVQAIHEDYRNAGCDLITTNSFGGSPTTLDQHGLAGRTVELNRAAAQLARAAAGDNAWVLGDVGPFGDFLEPMGDTTPEELRGIFRQQIEALLAGGADAVLVETMTDPGEAAVGVEAAKLCNPEIPAVVTYAFQKTADGSFRTMMGTTVQEAIGKALEAGADIVGSNCGTGLDLDDYVVLAGEVAAAAGNAPSIVQPNAGAPRVEGADTFYDATPEQMAACAKRILDAGVRIVGGCCGTTPAHMAAVAGVVG